MRLRGSCTHADFARPVDRCTLTKEARHGGSESGKIKRRNELGR